MVYSPIRARRRPHSAGGGVCVVSGGKAPGGDGRVEGVNGRRKTPTLYTRAATSGVNDVMNDVTRAAAEETGGRRRAPLSGSEAGVADKQKRGEIPSSVWRDDKVPNYNRKHCNGFGVSWRRLRHLNNLNGVDSVPSVSM